MDKTYNPQTIEQKWYQHWENHDYFKPSGVGTPYCIMIPPPNVTGSLHMGHGFQHAIMDALTRYHRMCGYNTLWQPGTDHAGISTQMVVERQLMNEGLTRHDLGREKFVERVWQWKQESGGIITQQFRRLGDSVDWSRERFTLDDGLSHAVKEVFIQLYDEGLIYKGKRLVNWDPVLLTAISDLEVIPKEHQGSLWHIKYPLKNSEEFIVVATTRPETMLGDTAVAVHPEDERYQHLIGQSILLPLSNREIPIIADDYVDREFGSGCVKITPAHDFNDYEIGLRHQLPMINIFTPNAHLNDQVPAIYQGLERFAARQKVIDDLQTQGYLLKIEKHTLSLPYGEKSNVVVEPYLTDQWYMSMSSLAKRALEEVSFSNIKFVPDNWHKIYNQWLENIQDWCISRQLWWGHQIPAWYDEHENIYVGHDEEDVRQKYHLEDTLILTRDMDVLDTWFSSALWPFSTLGWPEKTESLNTFYPTNVLVTGFDIIFFWVARMIMMGLKFTNDVPFKEVYITGLIRDSEGQKMSKTKGNVLDPIDLIDGIDLPNLIQKRTANMMQPHLAEKITKNTVKEFPDGIPAYGTDALRFTYCALATPGREIRFDINRLEGYRNFCNKIWNAARYIVLNCENKDNGFNSEEKTFSVADRWMQATLHQTIKNIHQHFATYRFDLLTQQLHETIWSEFCDWYLELSKPILYDENVAESLQRGTRHTLITVLMSLLKLAHPIMPFITEEIWQKLQELTSSTEDTIMLAEFPQYDESKIDEEALCDINWIKSVILGIRNIRGEMNISPNKKLPIFFYQGSTKDQQNLGQYKTFLISLAKLEDITWLSQKETPPPAATALAGEMKILIPLKGLIDVTAETIRLNKEIEKIDKEISKLESRLNNKKFVNNAPNDIVEKDKIRLQQFQQNINKLREEQEKINTL